MRLVLKPALRRLWRGPATVQIGVDPERAVVLSGCDDDVTEVLESLDGSREPLTLTDADLAGRHSELLKLLRGAGLLDDAHASTAPLPGLDHVHRSRLAPDLASLSLTSGAPDGGIDLLSCRRHAVIAVHGAGRVGAIVATLLGAVGIGTVTVVDGGVCRPADCAPGGLPPSALGRGRQQAISEQLETYGTRTTQPDVPPMAVVLTGQAANDPRTRRDLVEQRVPHLAATVRETTGLVGAFVVPGQSACLRCLDLHRTDRDPDWPLVAAQLAVSTRTPVEACDTVLATAVACWTVREVVGFLDGTPHPSTVNGSLELSTTDWQWRRRSWTPHPACGCTD